MKKYVFIAILVSGSFIQMSLPAHEQTAVVEEETTYVVAPSAPPADLAEEITPSPSPKHVWIPGHWNWDKKWVWIKGHWVEGPHPSAQWEPGHWSWRPWGHVWVHGHWR